MSLFGTAPRGIVIGRRFIGVSFEGTAELGTRAVLTLGDESTSTWPSASDIATGARRLVEQAALTEQVAINQTRSIEDAQRLVG
jgi:hypothetical protein